jgi:hypothetical protein
MRVHHLTSTSIHTQTTFPGLASDSMGQNARELAGRVAQEDGLGEAVALIESMGSGTSV